MRVYPTHVVLGCVGAAGLIGVLTGCAATPSELSYADGDYTADGSYAAPSGTETITVDLTLENGIVMGVTVTPHATGGNEAKFQAQFAGGIAGEVLGKNLDELSVARVAGSSLTSGGFNDALDLIRAEAAGN
jgi:hypothetical protein